jgi:hypothetical protein
MRVNLILIVLLLIAPVVSGQKLTTGFGKVTMADLEMNTYEPDTAASAVVLYQSGHFRAADLSFIFYRRVKVLRKEGTAYAEFTFRSDESTSVRGTTYNLVNGKIVKEKLSGGSIFKQMITKDLWLYRIAMPNVSEGTVFEIEYNQMLLPSEFRFQDRIPVLRAELILEPNELIHFRKTLVGYESVKTSKGIYFYSDYNPAFKSENYSYSDENYITKFEFDILSITIPGNHMLFTSDWASVTKVLLEDNNFGKVLSTPSGYLNTLRDEIAGQNLSPSEKLRAAFEAIRKISWNEEERLYSSAVTLRAQFLKGSANSSEINMMLFQLLEKLDIRCSMVALSTRDNGLLHPVYPSLQKFNYSIVYAEADGNKYLLDATDKYAPFGLLPVRCLNEQGRLIEPGGGRWIDLNSEVANRQTIEYDLALNSNMTMEGEVSSIYGGYGAYNFRTEYHTHTSGESYIEEIEADNPGLNITDYEFMDLDDITSDCKLKMKVELRGRVQRADDLLMINPFALEHISTNPFKSETRVYPVNFIYSRLKNVTVKLKLPEGYTVESIPKSAELKTKDNGFRISVNYNVTEDGSLIVKYDYDLKKITYMPDEYSEIREMYNRLISKQAEPVILKKIADGLH